MNEEDELEDNGVVIPAPMPYIVTFHYAEGFSCDWEIVCPVPHSVDHAYTQAKSGRARWVLTSEAKEWRARLQAAINLAVNNSPYKVSEVWDKSDDMMYRFTWYVKEGKGKNDVSNRIKLFEDALNKTAIWNDDSQVYKFEAEKIEGVDQGGFINVLIQRSNG